MRCTHAARRSLVSSLLLVACAGGTRIAPPASAARPNIVFVLLDDARFDDLVGHPFVELPNLRRLMREGASFERFFTAAPLCSPSRAVFMTGQYPFRNGIVDNTERAELSHRIVTFPRLLHDAGYRTGFFGKWHMSHEDDSPRPGFDRWVSFVGQGVYFDPELNIDGAQSKATGYMTDILTAQAVRFIREAPAEQPFLAFIAQKAVHPETHPNQVRSFPPAPGDERAFADRAVPHAPSWRAPLDGKPALARPADVSDPRSPAGGLPEEVVRDRLRMLLAVDRGLGEVIAALEAKGVLDRTMIVVTSDQGFFYGEFGLAQERRLAYEPSTRIPLIVRYPALVPAGSTPAVLASNVDIAPTLLELGGAPLPASIDGRSLVGALRGASAPVRDELLIEYYSDTEFPRLQGMGYKAIRTDRYKFIRYEELRGMDELYDLQADPHELKNLLPAHAPDGVMEELAARLDRMLERRPAPAGQATRSPRTFERVLLLEAEGATSAGVSLGDIDRDDDLDIVLAKGRHWPLQDMVLRNDGRGRFTTTPLRDEADRTYSAALADLDGDGDLDIVSSNDRPDKKLVYLNDGTGRFRVASEFGAPDWSTRYVTVAELNGDARPDLIVANRGGGTSGGRPSFVCMNDGSGAFPSCAPLATRSATFIVAADLDRDGAVDLFVPHRDGGRNLVFWNDGKGTFTAPPVAMGPEQSSIRAAAAGDIDGDGLTDLLVGDLEKGLFVYLGLGGRRFAEPVALEAGRVVPGAIALADLDRDGRLDVVVGNDQLPGVVLFNQGGGKTLRFALASWNDGRGSVYAIAIGDLDGDGWPDIAAARSEAPNAVWFSGTSTGTSTGAATAPRR